MGVNFIAAKNSTKTGRIGNSAKKEKAPPRMPSPLRNSIRRTNSQSATSVAAKKTSVQIEPMTCRIRRPQKKKERSIGHWEMRCTVGFFGFQMPEGSTRTWILPL
jgi:hypothetical protein